MATTENAVDVVMPQMGVSVSEGTVTKWLRQVGDEVRADDTLLEISTDKVDTEVPSPATGTLVQILVREGETVDVGTKLGQIGGTSGAPAPAPAPPAPAPAPAADTPAPAPPPRLLLQLRLRRLPPRRRPATGSSSLRWSRASPPSTASTRTRFPAPAAAAA